VTPNWHLAQINVGRLVGTPDDPRVVPFMAALDRINALSHPVSAMGRSI